MFELSKLLDYLLCESHYLMIKVGQHALQQKWDILLILILKLLVVNCKTLNQLKKEHVYDLAHQLVKDNNADLTVGN